MKNITAKFSDYKFGVELYTEEYELLMDSLSRTIYHYDLKKGSREELSRFCFLYKELKTEYDKIYPDCKITNKRTAEIIAELTA
jgi:hypothetical protein